jgi:hypothetical protein
MVKPWKKSGVGLMDGSGGEWMGHEDAVAGQLRMRGRVIVIAGE